MKPSEIISLARRQTGCTEDIVTTDEAYKFLNFVIEDFGADIRNSDSWYWFDIVEIPVVWWQSSYQFDNVDWSLSNKFPIHKIQAVWLYDWSDKKRRDLPVHFVDKVDLNKRESVKEPLACFITKESLNLIPTPKESTNMQVRWFNYNTEIASDLWYITVWWNEYTRDKNSDVSWATYPYAWTYESTTIFTDDDQPTSWTAYSTYSWTSAWSITAYRVQSFDSEENIFIDKRWHYILVEWLKYRMYGNMWVNFEAARTNSRNFYDSEKMKAIQNIVDRWQLADTAYFPDLNYLNY